MSGKKRVDALEKYDQTAQYPPSEAMRIVKETATASFDETVDAAFSLSIDARQADQAVRGTVSLPHGTGKDVRVVVFAEGEDARAAEAAGADVVGGSDLAASIESGAQAIDWDVTISHPSLMAEVGKLGKALGPRGLMPNPKAGTVTTDIGKTVDEFKAGRVEYRNDRYGNVHVAIGKASFQPEQLLANFAAVVDELIRVRPAATKGRYMKKIALSSTMGPSVRVDPGALDELKDR
jgi:large subunit ribosomal protein L1